MTRITLNCFLLWQSLGYVIKFSKNNKINFVVCNLVIYHIELQFIKTDELIGLRHLSYISYKHCIHLLLYLLQNDLATNYLVQCSMSWLFWQKYVFVIIGNNLNWNNILLINVTFDTKIFWKVTFFTRIFD